MSLSQESTQSASKPTSAIFSEIEQAFGGHIPNLFKVYARYPPLLEANWGKFKAIMLDGQLRREVKEAVALLISHDNECKYCITAHAAVLRSMRFDEEKIAGMLQNVLPADFTGKEAALIKFAREANNRWHEINEDSIKALFDLGVGEPEILEIIGVMELFIAFNRFADVMGIKIDF
ncbi:MAG: peroxidase-related enzyme [Nitrosomonas sp.]|nr:peroxidase-related enzyme [Nitrosomonas sp.]